MMSMVSPSQRMMTAHFKWNGMRMILDIVFSKGLSEEEINTMIVTGLREIIAREAEDEGW